MTARTGDVAVAQRRGGARGVIGTVVLALLVIVAQSGLAAAGDSNKWLGGLHALDGMVILLLSLWLAVTAWRRRTAA